MLNPNIWPVAIFAFIVGLFFYKPLSKLRYSISNRTRSLKSYWTFSLIFMICCAIAYWVIFRYSPQSNLGANLNILANVSTLIFAIFVGYFAFAAVAENRLDKFKERGNNYIVTSDFKRAIQEYDEARKINPRDPYVLTNLLEACLVDGNISKFDELFPLYKKIAFDGKEKLIAFYLEIAKDLLTQNLAPAKEKLAKCLEYIKSQPDSLARLIWSFREIRDVSGQYGKLTNGEDPKIILDNFITYLSKELSTNQKLLFESGNYKLIKPESLTIQVQN